jgi:hypothetical protein
LPVGKEKKIMDDEKKIQRYFGYETLVKLGGFIGAKAQSLLYDLYPDEVCEVIENTGGIDENFWTLAYELRFVLDGYNTPEIYKENNDGTEEAVWADRGEGSFFMFHMVATAVCIRNKKYHKKQLYGSFKVSKKLKNLLLSLAPLESTVLWEHLGLGVSEAGSAEDISRKMDFCSTPAFIRQILYRIEKFFDRYPKEWEELTEYVSHLREGEGA